MYYTPEEIRNIEFTKSLGGYRTSEVDPFIDKCADTVEALLKEKDELTKKLEVLADKLVEYRNEEDSIRTALLSAQRMGDAVVREANHKAGLILEDANIKAEKIAETARRNIQEEEAELRRVQQAVSDFKRQLLSMYREHLAAIDVMPELKEESSDPVPETSAPVEPTVEMKTEEAAPSTEPAPVEAVSEAESVAVPQTEDIPVTAEDAPAFFQVNIPELDEEETASIQPVAAASAARPNPRFADLKFGEDYNMSEEAEEKTGFFRRKK